MRCRKMNSELIIVWTILAQSVSVLSQFNGTFSELKSRPTQSPTKTNSINVLASSNKSGTWEHECEFADGPQDTLCKKYACLSNDTEIRRRQLCDGVFDCPDFSDECLCNIRSRENMKTAKICDQLLYQDFNECCIGYVQCDFHGRKICVPGSHICDGIVHCTDGLDEAFCYNNANIESVTRGLIGPTELAFVDDKVPDNDSIFRRCPSTNEIASMTRNRSSFGELKGVFVDWRRVYDGVADCAGGADEWKSTYLYCFNNWQSFRTDEDVRCYGNSTATSGGHKYNGKGLGDNCDHHLQRLSSSSLYMYTSRGYPIFWAIFGFVAVTINSVVIAHQMSYYCKRTRVENSCDALLRSKSANRILVVNLSLLYSLSGIIMISKAIADYVTMGRHWQFSDQWRDKAVCICSAFFFTAVMSVTVLIYAFLTGIRLFTFLYPFRSVKMGFIYGILAICWILPILVTVCHIPNSLVELVKTPNLPQVDAIVLETEQVREIARRSFVLHSILNDRFPIENMKLQTMEISSLTKFLEDFAPKFVKEWSNVGVYSSYALCLPQVIIKLGEPGWKVIVMLTLVDTTIYLLISLAYAFMFMKVTRRKCCLWQPTNVPIIRPTTSNRSTNSGAAMGRREIEDKSMHRRIFWMIFINMITWLPLCIINLLFNYTQAHVRTAFTKEVLLILIHAQALFSPFFYSRLLRHAFHSKVIRPVKFLFTVCKTAIFK